MSKKCKSLVVLVLCILVALPALADEKCTAVFGTGSHTFSLATGSPGELGMLKALTDVFNTKYDTSMCWRKAGSGKSLKLLKQKEVDVVMVHAPAAEKQAVKEGWAIKRSLIGSNEFYIVGPKNDPANISNVKSAAEAYANIAKIQAFAQARPHSHGEDRRSQLDEFGLSGAGAVVHAVSEDHDADGPLPLQ